MPEVKQSLEDALRRQGRLVDEINANGRLINEINQKRQMLLQEALRVDGEVRILKTLSNNGGKG